MNKKYLLFVLLLTLFSSFSCSLIGVKEWNAYKVTIEVRDSYSHLIPDASVTSMADKTEKAKAPGTYNLLFTATGIHVVTISAPKKQTKQIRFVLPRDNEKIMTVILADS